MLRSVLRQAREKRIRPGLDDKVLADWNGLMIAALANAGAMLNEPAWIGMATRAFDFIAKAMTRGDRLGHSWREGKLLYPGLASDYAAMIKAALALARGDWRQAISRPGAGLADRRSTAITRTRSTAAITSPPMTPKGLVVRPDSTLDDATPNPNGIAAQNLVRLAVFSGDETFRAKADRLIEGVLSEGSEQPVRAHLDTERGRYAHPRRGDRDRGRG